MIICESMWKRVRGGDWRDQPDLGDMMSDSLESVTESQVRMTYKQAELKEFVGLG